MGQITSLFFRKVLDVVDTDADRDALLRSSGMAEDGVINPKQMIPDASYYAFLEKLATVDRKPWTLPLRAGAVMRCDDYGLFGLAWKSATNLLGSYERAVRYARVLTSVSTYQVEETNQGAYMHLHRDGERTPGMRMSNEATIASIVSISRQVASSDFHPLAVYFKHPAPKIVADHVSYFGCPVYFGAGKDALLVSTEQLLTPNKLGDRSISKFFDGHLDNELSNYEDDHPLELKIRKQVSRTLSQGVPTVHEVARSFGMSERTLQRKLAERKHSFQTLLDDSRRQLAERLLKQTDYSLTEVAFMTGFSEQSAFTRAFKRWAGQTPRSFRLQPQC